jgi:hypothetical protein
VVFPTTDAECDDVATTGPPSGASCYATAGNHCNRDVVIASVRADALAVVALVDYHLPDGRWSAPAPSP